MKYCLSDSLFRYLSQHIPARVKDFVPAVCFRSGAKVEDLIGGSAWDLINQKTQVCVVHVGTNDLKNPCRSVDSVLEHFKIMLAELHKKSPELEIFISSVLPRGLNLWDRITPVPIMSQRTEQLNSKVSKFSQSCLNRIGIKPHLITFILSWSVVPQFRNLG